MEITLLVLKYLLPAILGIVALLLTLGTKKLLDKWGIERSAQIDLMIDDYVKKGVNAAEAWANTYSGLNGEKPVGTSKKARAIAVVMEELKQSGVINVAEQLVSDRIEGWLLESGHNPGIPSDPTPGENA